MVRVLLPGFQHASISFIQAARASCSGPRTPQWLWLSATPLLFPAVPGSQRGSSYSSDFERNCVSRGLGTDQGLGERSHSDRERRPFHRLRSFNLRSGCAACSLQRDRRSNRLRQCEPRASGRALFFFVGGHRPVAAIAALHGFGSGPREREARHDKLDHG